MPQFYFKENEQTNHNAGAIAMRAGAFVMYVLSRARKQSGLTISDIDCEYFRQHRYVSARVTPYPQ
jgi:hypothetical protein